MVMSKVKSLGNKINDYLEEHWRLALIAMVILGLAIVGYSVFGPDNGSTIIQKRLSEAGYDVTAIEFEKIENANGLFAKKLYKSSREIEYAPGVFIDEWELRNVGIGRASYWIATPYPELPKPVDLRISVSQEEYERLSIQANGLSVEEYLEQAIDHMVSDT